MKKSHAFTLIELLVVIAIIAVLAGIALPVFTKVQEKGRATTDLNNLKQLGVGTVVYLNDNDGAMFHTSSPTPWPLKLAPLASAEATATYVSDWKTFLSPFDTRPLDTVNPNVSYGVNNGLLTAPEDYRNLSNYNRPSQLILMAPAPDFGAAEVVFKGTATQNVVLPNTPPATPRGTHGNRRQINVLFVDSHVATMNWRDFCNISGTEGKARWDPAAQ